MKDVRCLLGRHDRPKMRVMNGYIYSTRHLTEEQIQDFRAQWLRLFAGNDLAEGFSMVRIACLRCGKE